MHPYVALKVTTSRLPVLLTVSIKQLDMFQWIPVKMIMHYLLLFVVCKYYILMIIFSIFTHLCSLIEFNKGNDGVYSAGNEIMCTYHNILGIMSCSKRG